MNEEKRCLYLLSCLPGMTNNRLMKLYQAAGSFAEAYAMEAEELVSLGGFDSLEKSFDFDGRKEREGRLIEELAGFERKGIRLISFLDGDYPKRLEGLPDAPCLLYVKGRLPSDEIPSAAIIGGRRCSGYGVYAAEHTAGLLSAGGVQIISGMALGIDSAAQRAALAGGHDSFSVLGSGVEVCYPGASRDIYELMAGGRGGVISEFPPYTPPEAWRFVSRNRIIAGLSDAVIVCEARKKSGTAITVEYALTYGRDVFAVPHRITDELGEGCNGLIRDGANILTDMDDLFSALGSGCEMAGSKAEKIRPEQKNLSNLARNEKMVYSRLDFNAKHIDEIMELADMPAGELLKALFGLETKGLARSSQGAYYRKVY